MREPEGRPRRRLKIWWILAVLFVAFIVGGVLLLPRMIDATSYRGLIESRAQETLGREVRLGQMRVSLWPVFGVRIDDLVIASLPEEGPGDLLSAESLRVGARLFPLLQRRLEVTSIVVEAPVLRLERGADDRWNVERLLPEQEPGKTEPGAGVGFRIASLVLTDGRVTLRDAGSTRSKPYEAVVESLQLEIEDLSPDRPLSVELDGTLTGPSSAMRIGYSGTIGPLQGATPLGIDGELRLDNAVASRLLAWFPEPPELPSGLGDQPFSAKVVVRATGGVEGGPVFQELALAGTFEMRDAKLSYLAPDGRARNTTEDLAADYDVIGANDWDTLQIRALKVGVGKNRLAIQGNVEKRGKDRWLDLVLSPTRIPADDLIVLLSLVSPDLPLSFASKTPVELEGSVRGVFGGPRLPELKGKAKLEEFTLGHPSMTKPIERVGAEVTLSGDQIEVRSFSGVVGSSDVAGQVTLRGFDAPRVTFDLESTRADLGELFSFLREDESAPATGAAGEEALTDLAIDGTVKVRSGSFETLDFTDLEMRMRHTGGSLTLDPLRAKLYDGVFEGSIKADLDVSPPRFEIRGEIERVDTNAFLTDNLESKDMLSGRFSGRVETRGNGVDYASIAQGLLGTGSMEVLEGHVGKLDVLATLAKVSGVFGETTLKRLTQSLAEDGTEFGKMTSGLKFANGLLAFENLVLESPGFSLTGQGSIDLLQALLDGKFRLTFSSEISESMQAEGSRAAGVFWNRRTNRVELPFTLSGPFDAPSAGIDFGSVAEGAIRGAVEDKLTDLLGRGKKKASPQDAEQLAPAPKSTLPGPKPPAAPSGLAALIDSVGWGGSFLLRDLELGGVVRGPGITGASLSVTDADGKEVQRTDPLPEVAAYLASGAAPETPADVRFWVRVEGKRLLAAKFPLVVRLIVTDETGLSIEAAEEVKR